MSGSELALGLGLPSVMESGSAWMLGTDSELESASVMALPWALVWASKSEWAWESELVSALV